MLNLLTHTDIEKIGSSTNETHQQIALGIGIPLGSKVLLTTALKLEVLAVRRHTAFPYHVFLSQLTHLLINLPHSFLIDCSMLLVYDKLMSYLQAFLLKFILRIVPLA